MTSGRSPLLAAALALALVLGGCGSSSTSSSTASPAQSTASSTPSTSAAPALTGANAAEAVELCKKEIAAQTTLPASAKAKLEGVCNKASTGDSAAVKKAAEEVCEEVINTSPVPAGTDKEQALAACKGK